VNIKVNVHKQDESVSCPKIIQEKHVSFSFQNRVEENDESLIEELPEENY